MAHDEIAASTALRARGLRVTRQRLLILDAVCEGGGHSTAPDVVERAKRLDHTIDQSTVHRTLALFCKLGLVAAHLDESRRWVYEVVGTVPHHHLRCTECGTEREIAHDEVRPLLESLTAMHGFTPTVRHLVIDGVCESCRVRAIDGSA